MANYTAVSLAKHSTRTWHRLDSYWFYANERTAPLVAAEFPRACVAFPVAWVKNNGLYEPIALLGLAEFENLFVDASYRWIGTYVPAHLQTQPFRLIPTEDEQLTLGVREDIGLVTENASGQPFFDGDGELSDALQEVVDMLRKLEANRAATARACLALSEAEVLEPWDIALVVNGERRQLGGLYHVSQEALNGTNAQTLQHLRETGALAMAYCQQVSQHLIQRLTMLHERQNKEQIKRSSHPADQGSFGLGFDDSEGGISFGGIGGSTP